MKSFPFFEKTYYIKKGHYSNFCTFEIASSRILIKEIWYLVYCFWTGIKYPYLLQQPSNSTLDISKDQAETIRSAMAGFQLPESAIPSWASQLSDEELQKMLQDKLQTGPIFSTRKK